ncbi:MAG: branched-chain amino acid ABC transporter permease [Actinobacteria bacterium]|jgi:branched-chain amino acid transport system permease protein|nr:branched-chain amino acid ABC transporter permease [Actinomycetota bacterium]
MDVDFTRVLVDGLRTGLGPVAAVYALAAIGLNVHYGYTGLLNFGQVGFMLVGAYGMGIAVSIHSLPLWLGIILGMLAAVALALLLGFPTLRLRADYLAICTIAAAEILRFVFRSSPMAEVTGGAFGIPSQVGGSGFSSGFYRLNPIPEGAYGIGPVMFSHTRLWMMLVAWLLVALAVVLVWALMRSPWGRVIKSIREDEDAARALGKNVFAYKMQSLVLGGVLGGVAGIVLVMNQGAMTPDQFLPQLTFFAYTVLLLGGAATVVGPVLGSILFWFILQAMDSLLRQTGFGSAALGAVRLAFVGLILILLMAFRPQGLLGNKQEMMLDA